MILAQIHSKTRLGINVYDIDFFLFPEMQPDF